MTLVEGLIQQSPYPEVAYKSAMGIIQLHKEYGSQRINNACQRAINGNALRYQVVKNILKSNLDTEQLSMDHLNETTPHIPQHDNIRGASHYQ